MNSMKNMFIISFDNSIAIVSLEGNNIFLYEKLVTDNGIALEVQEVDPHTAKCIIYGDYGLLKPNTVVHRTREYMTIKFKQSFIGKVISPDMKILSDGIIAAKHSDEDSAEEIVNLNPPKYSINATGTSKSVMPTGIKVIDFFTPLTYGSKIGIMGGAGVGKAQPLSAMLYNELGPIIMRDVKIGDKVLGVDGFVSIKGIYPQGSKMVYRVCFEDDRVVECCEDHLWPVYDYSGVSILPLKEIMCNMKISDVYIALEKCMFSNNATLSVSIIILYGLIQVSLASIDGNNILISKETHNSLFAAIAQEYTIVDYDNDNMAILNCDNNLKNSVQNIEFGQFLYCDLVSRASLVSAICNIDPDVILKGNKCIYILDKEKIQNYCNTFASYVQSLGGFIVLYSDQFEVTFNACCIKIKSITPTTEQPVQCISVDAQNGIYITDNFIPTHNTTLMLEIIKNISTDKLFKIFCGVGERIREGLEMYLDFIKSGIIDVENPRASDSLLIYGNMDQSAAMRQLAGRAGVALARHMMDQYHKDVIIIIDNIFRYNQASCEIGTSLNQFQTERGYHPNIRSMMSRLQENMLSLNNGNSATSIQAIYVPADDNTDIGALTCQEHQSVSILLSRELAKQKIYPAVDLLGSWSVNLQEGVVGKRHLAVYKKTIVVLDKYRQLLDLINIVGIENLSFEDQQTVKRATLIQAYMTQPLSVTQQFINLESSLVDIEDVISDVANILDGAYDDFTVSELKFKGTIKNLKHISE